MSELLSKLGIDWKLLIAQIINFLVLLFVLWKFAYGPILAILDKRTKKIEQGLKDAEASRKKLADSEERQKEILKMARTEGKEIVEKAREQNITGNMDTDAEPIELSRLLHRFPEAVEYAARELEPHLLTNYLLEFASAFNRWYANEQILDGSAGAPHKVALTDAARRTLKNGLWLLGIPAPEQM